jgi:hypothetical protein
MADDIRIVPEGGAPAAVPKGARVETDFDDPEAARAEIASTRARMSETIDEIEDVLLRKKARLQDRLDVRARIREKPLHAFGIALGFGLLVGLVTGGGDEDGRPSDEPSEGMLRERAERRERRLEHRVQRILRVAREQQAEMELLQRRLARQERDRHRYRGVFSVDRAASGARKIRESTPVVRLREGVSNLVSRVAAEIESRT